jgi:hypothetical protein
MSFGFSVGDFLTVAQLVCDITKSLRDSGGARSEYQELIRELETLNSALEHIDTLQRGSEQPAPLDSIKYAALSCRQPLEQFLGKIRKYGRSLDVWAKGGIVQSAADKLKWTFGHKEEVKKLQNYLNLHVGVINMLLAEHGIAMMTTASEKTEADYVRIREKLQITRTLISGINQSISSQALLIQRVHAMLATLIQMVNGELRTSWQTLGEMVAKVWYAFYTIPSGIGLTFNLQHFHPANIWPSPGNPRLSLS